MTNNKNDVKSELKQITSEYKLRQTLANERIYAVFGVVLTLSVMLVGLYWTLAEGRLEIVYLNQDKIDSPTILPKMRSDAAEVQVDRWIRGFTRRVLSYSFIHRDDSDQFAERSLKWMHAHSTSKAGQKFHSLFSDLSAFQTARKEKYAAFYPVNDPSAMKIRKSGVTNSRFFVEIPGTYHIFTTNGESFFDSKLKFVIDKTAITGIPSSLGEINRSGLVVVEGGVEFVEDVNKPAEITRINLFDID